MFQEHVADTFLTLEDLLEQNEVFVLDRVDVAGQVLRNLLHCQVLSVLIILVEFLPQLLVDTLLTDLLTQNVAVVHMIAHTL